MEIKEASSNKDRAYPRKAVALAARFVRLVAGEWHRHDIMSMASSLCYTSLLALVPVFAIFLGVVGSVRDGMYTEMFITTLKSQVPAVAGMDNLVDAIREIASDATAILGIGILMFISTGFFLFITVVKDFNRIWRVERSRSLLARLSGFVTAVILVPLLMVLSLYVNLYVGRTVDTLENVMAPPGVAELLQEIPGPDSREKPGALADETGTADEEKGDEESVGSSFPLSPKRLIYDSGNPDAVSREVEGYRSGGLAVQVALHLTSLLLAIMAMSALYYLLPNRRIKWWAALSGGVFAGFLLELGNYFFRIYASMSSTMLMKIYGTLLAVPLGLLWLWILWVIVLLGSVVCYTAQHFRELSADFDLEEIDRKHDLYIGLLLTIGAAECYEKGESSSGLVESLAVETGFPEVLIKNMQEKLVELGVLVKTEGEDGAKNEFIPARGVSAMTLDQVVMPLLENAFEGSARGEDWIFRKVSRILESAGYTLRENLSGTTLGDLISVERVPEESIPAEDS